MSAPDGLTAGTGDAEPRHYHLFISHSHADADLVEAMALQLEELNLRCFLDRWEMVPGESSIFRLEEALAASDTAAVVVARHGMGRWHAEEARQALRRAIDHGMRAFIVWMPGSDPNPPGLSEWLGERTHVDLRNGMVDGRVTHDGVVLLVAGTLGMPPRKARRWLYERLPPAADRGSGTEDGRAVN